MKVYVVTAGEYSDYRIEEVFLDKKKAEIYVAAKYKDGWGRDYTIEVYETKDDSVDVVDDQIVWMYEAHGIYPGGLYYETPVCIFKKDYQPRDYHTVSQAPWFDCILEKRNDAKGKKILDDKYAEYRARKEGLV